MRLQNWHTDYFLDHQDLVALDSNCDLMQVVINVDNLAGNRHDPDEPTSNGLILRDGRLRNTQTNTTPLILHFPGGGHWPDWWHTERVGSCAAYELLRSAGHPTLVKLLEKQSAEHK